MRAFIIVVALVVLAGIAWFYFSADEAGPMVEDAAGTASEAADATDEAADDAAMATDAASDADEGTADAANEVLDNTLGTESDAGDATDGSVDEPAETGDDSLAEALTVDGFDPDRLRTAVENSGLGEAEKQAAVALIDSAEQNPALVQSVIQQLQAEFGL